MYEQARIASLRRLFIGLFVLALLCLNCAASYAWSGKKANISQSDSFIAGWTEVAAEEVLSFGFHNHKDVLSTASRHFTEEGWDSFSKALHKSRTVDSVVANEQILTTKVREPFAVISHEVKKGRDQWVVQGPITMTYEAGTKKRTSDLRVTIIVVQSDEPQNENGIGIQQWIAVLI